MLVLNFFNKLTCPIAFLFAMIPFTVSADELIEQNVMGANEDLYLIEKSIKQTEVADVVWAVYYYSMDTPRESVEIFDGDANVIGHERFGLFQSYGYFGAFDCRRRLVATLAVQYFSGRTPHGAKILKHEDYFPIYEEDFQLPLNETLLYRVCELARR